MKKLYHQMPNDVSYNCYTFMISNINEQAIKSNLSHFDHEEHQSYSQQFNQVMRSKLITLRKAQSFQEVSDWTNRYTIHQSSAQTLSGDHTPSIIKPIKTAFIANFTPKNCHSSCDDSKKQYLLLSPINVTFKQHSKIKCQKSLRKTQFSMRQMSLSVYDCNYKSLQKLYDIKFKQKGQQLKKIEMPSRFELPIRQSRLPKTEMISGIMRIMKKKQQIKTYRKTYSNLNPQKTHSIHCTRMS